MGLVALLGHLPLLLAALKLLVPHFVAVVAYRSARVQELIELGRGRGGLGVLVRPIAPVAIRPLAVVLLLLVAVVVGRLLAVNLRLLLVVGSRQLMLAGP